MTLRFDRVPIKAQRTDTGYIRDTPVLTRTGVFSYRNPDGTERREYRPEAAVFAADSLAGFAAIPITDGHPGKVTSKNVRHAVVGTVLSPGRQDGNNLLADIIIYDTAPVEAGRKELSVGYEVDLDETPGVTPEGEHYDAIQTSIRPNHLALVQRGRAGNARLNLDAADEVAETGDTEMPNENMVQVRLDGLTYQASPEVAKALETLREDVKSATEAKDAAEAKADALAKKVKEHEDGAEQAKADAFAAAKARIELEARADELHVSFDESVSDLSLQKEIIKKIMGDDVKLDERSDAYIQAAYDMAINERSKRADTVAHNRQTATDTRADADSYPSAASARAKFISEQMGV